MDAALKESTAGLKLNLGSGQHPKPGYINVDRHAPADVIHDLEQLPWPWETSSVSEILMQHVLEHLGRSTESFLRIIQELYRVCRHGAMIHITVPHPRHDAFLSDPTHVRAILPETWELFSKEMNQMWKQKGFSNSPLALQLDVDFKLLQAAPDFAGPWKKRLDAGAMTRQQVAEAAMAYNNVVEQIRMDVQVIKP